MDGLKKAQAAFEFVSYFGFFLLIFVFAVAFMTSEELKDVKVKQELLAKETAYSTASEINFAARAGEGYSRSVELSPKITGMDYNMSVKNGFLNLNLTRGEEVIYVIAPLATSDVKTQGAYAGDGSVPIDPSRGMMYISVGESGVVYVDQPHG